MFCNIHVHLVVAFIFKNSYTETISIQDPYQPCRKKLHLFFVFTRSAAFLKLLWWECCFEFMKFIILYEKFIKKIKVYLNFINWQKKGTTLWCLVVYALFGKGRNLKKNLQHLVVRVWSHSFGTYEFKSFHK